MTLSKTALCYLTRKIARTYLYVSLALSFSVIYVLNKNLKKKSIWFILIKFVLSFSLQFLYCSAFSYFLYFHIKFYSFFSFIPFFVPQIGNFFVCWPIIKKQLKNSQTWKFVDIVNIEVHPSFQLLWNSRKKH